MSYPKRNMVGFKNNKLTIIGDEPDRKGFRFVRCKCECGNEYVLRMTAVTTGATKSCGCAYKEGNAQKCKTHGLSTTRFYLVYKALKNRCENTKVEKFPIYGARGIKCLWRTFEEFRDDMYEGYLRHKEQNPGRGTTIDRIDVDGNYCKENCRWATFKEQANNKQCHKYGKIRSSERV